MGIPATPEEVFGSSYSAAIYISRILPNDNPQLKEKPKVFVVGEAGIEAELDSEGVPHIGGTDPNLRRDVTPEDYKLMADADPSLIDPEVGVVLIGLDFHYNYFKMCLAFQYLRRGALFLATNVDSTLPSAGGLFPGAGSMSSPLANMLGGKQPVSFGKPSQAMMDAIEGKFKFERSKACMIGDRAVSLHHIPSFIRAVHRKQKISDANGQAEHRHSFRHRRQARRHTRRSDGSQHEGRVLRGRNKTGVLC